MVYQLYAPSEKPSHPKCYFPTMGSVLVAVLHSDQAVQTFPRAENLNGLVAGVADPHCLSFTGTLL